MYKDSLLIYTYKTEGLKAPSTGNTHAIIIKMVTAVSQVCTTNCKVHFTTYVRIVKISSCFIQVLQILQKAHFTEMIFYPIRHRVYSYN